MEFKIYGLHSVPSHLFINMQQFSRNTTVVNMVEYQFSGLSLLVNESLVKHISKDTEVYGEITYNFKLIILLSSFTLHFSVIMNIIQEHIPNANVSSLFDDLDIEIPRIGSSTSNNSLSSNGLLSSRSHDDKDIVDNMLSLGGFVIRRFIDCLE